MGKHREKGKRGKKGRKATSQRESVEELQAAGGPADPGASAAGEAPPVQARPADAPEPARSPVPVGEPLSRGQVPAPQQAAPGVADESASRKGSPAAGAVSRTRSARRRRGRARNPFRRFFLRLRGAREALLWSVILLVLAQKFNVEAVAQEHGIANADELLVATPLVLFGLGEIWDFVSGKLLEYLGVGTMFVLGLGKLLGGSSAAVPVPVEYPIPGDSSRIEHVTHHPDSTRVSAAASWVKTVRFVNEGSVDWPVRQICRVGAHDDPREIQSPRCIALPPLRSGDSTDVTIPLQAPEVVARGGEWKLARFKMVDGDMRQVFPGKSALRADARVRR